MGGGGDTFSGACRSIRCAALGHSGCHVSPSVRSGARERLQVLVDLHVCFPTRRPLQGTRACVCVHTYVYVHMFQHEDFTPGAYLRGNTGKSQRMEAFFRSFLFFFSLSSYFSHLREFVETAQTNKDREKKTRSGVRTFRGADTKPDAAHAFIHVFRKNILHFMCKHRLSLSLPLLLVSHTQIHA